MTLLDRIDQRLAALGLTDEAASKKAGLHRDTIRDLRRAKRNGLTSKSLFSLAEALETSVEWLMKGDAQEDLSSSDNIANWLEQQFAKTGKSKSGLAKAWGVDPAAVSKVIKGEREVKAVEVEVAKAYFDDPEPLFQSSEPQTHGIPEIDVRAGAGGGGFSYSVNVLNGDGSQIVAEDYKATWALPSRFLREELRTNQNVIQIVEVLGDSMEPSLKSGDRVLIDTSHKVPSPPGIYAVWDGYGVVIKRVEPVRNSDRPMVRLISDNKNHSAYEVSVEDAHIIGRAICKISTM